MQYQNIKPKGMKRDLFVGLTFSSNSMKYAKTQTQQKTWQSEWVIKEWELILFGVIIQIEQTQNFILIMETISPFPSCSNKVNQIH